MEALKDNLESQLLGYIEDVQKEYNELSKQEAEINKRKTVLQETLANLQGTLRFHQAKLGRKEQEKPEFGEITSVREAAHIALQRYGEMDKEELRDKLVEGGFKFGNRKPILAIHMALIGDPLITITEKGTYQWVGNNKAKAPILSLPKAIIKFFTERNNEPASLTQVLEGIKQLGMRTAAKDLKGNVDAELRYSGDFEQVEDGKYRLKTGVFEHLLNGQARNS